MNPLHRRPKTDFSGTGPVQGVPAKNPFHRAMTLLAFAGILLFTASIKCKNPEKPREEPETPAVPEIASVPYVAAGDVWVEARYSPQHFGIDFSALKAVPILAPGAGVFHKSMYYYEAIPRWQINAEIRVGDWAIDCLFEPGNYVTEEEGQTQFDMLVADGTKVKAGDPLGTLIFAEGAFKNYFHLGVRLTTTSPGTPYCPMPYCTEAVRAALLELYRRDHPGGQICDCHVYLVP
ncbi:MAG TPA: hypothetical protein VGB38_08735 [bacterium]